jgi:hypothetical protein
VVSRVNKDGDLIERACAIAGIVSPDDGVDRVIEEVAFDREAELGKDIVAGFEIVTDAGIENGFAINRLIAKTGAPRLEKVHADGGAKDRALVRSEKILKRAWGVVRLFERNMGRNCNRRGVCANWNDTNVFGAK